jgi:hypothetical protein
MSESDLTEEQARQERLRLVDRQAHWLYLAAVLLGSVLVMIVLMALLDAIT